jgi:nucleotide-binding universal stress UspA family protein
MKKILVPIDFTKTADNAFEFAADMAHKYNAELILFHSFEFPFIDSQIYLINYMEVYNSFELAEFEFFKDKIAVFRTILENKNYTNLKMNHILAEGQLLQTVQKVVEKEKIDLIVMGTDGAHDWIDNTFGTNTSNLIQLVSVPVLTIPASTKFKAVETIAFTTRFREKDLNVLEEVIKISKIFEAKVKCFYVKKKDSDVSQDTIDKWIDKYHQFSVQVIVIEGEDVEQAIVDFMFTQQIDILAIVTYKRSFFEKLFKRSITVNLAKSNEVPVLAFHA